MGISFATLKFLKSPENWVSRRTRKCVVLLLLLSLFGCFGVLNIYIEKPFTAESESKHDPTFEEIVSKDIQFDIEAHDVIVLLRVQKTGGSSFDTHLVRDLELKRNCLIRRSYGKHPCFRPGPHSWEYWLFSGISTGWVYGLHADWTELHACLEQSMNDLEISIVKRRYFYITFLREPVSRYVSEFCHVRTGKHWNRARLFCNGRSATEDEVPRCYMGEHLKNLTLHDFYSCDSNLANNRQTRMLANLMLVNCYDKSKMLAEEREALMLASAKRNLYKMPFFGITGMQEKSQYMFEKTFKLKFKVRFKQHNNTRSADVLSGLTDTELKRIKEVNKLDIQLYEYAKNLFENRYKKLKDLDPHFEEYFSNMGSVSYIDSDGED